MAGGSASSHSRSPTLEAAIGDVVPRPAAAARDLGRLSPPGCVGAPTISSETSSSTAPSVPGVAPTPRTSTGIAVRRPPAIARAMSRVPPNIDSYTISARIPSSMTRSPDDSEGPIAGAAESRDLATFRVRAVTLSRRFAPSGRSEPGLLHVEPDPDPAPPQPGLLELAVDQRPTRIHDMEGLRRPQQPVTALAEPLGCVLRRRAGHAADPEPGVERERVAMRAAMRERLQPLPKPDGLRTAGTARTARTESSGRRGRPGPRRTQPEDDRWSPHDEEVDVRVGPRWRGSDRDYLDRDGGRQPVRDGQRDVPGVPRHRLVDDQCSHGSSPSPSVRLAGTCSASGTRRRWRCRSRWPRDPPGASCTSSMT